MGATPALYLDNNATAPLRPEAVEAMRAAMGPPSNPSSVHVFGRAARLLVEGARENIAMLAGCHAADIVFTSGGTEANNLALSSFEHVITTAIEHDSVLHAAVRITMLMSMWMVALTRPPSGLSGGGAGWQAGTDDVVGYDGNNETGVISQLMLLWRWRAAGIVVHSDMVMLGKTHLDFTGSGLIMPAFRRTSIRPTGIGAVLVRSGNRLTSVLRGGGQEKGRRPGTENVLGIAGFGACAGRL